MKSKLVHGGEYRKKRSGRGARPLSSKKSHHIVFKINKSHLKNGNFRHPKNFDYVQKVLKRYAKRFFIKIEHISYQHNHIHILARSTRRSFFHHFFRVFTGQIAQNMKVTDTPKRVGAGPVTDTPKRKVVLWLSRPFTRVVVGRDNFLTTRNYIQLNEKEVTGVIPYRSSRLKGLSLREWLLLWTI